MVNLVKWLENIPSFLKKEKSAKKENKKIFLKKIEKNERNEKLVEINKLFTYDIVPDPGLMGARFKGGSDLYNLMLQRAITTNTPQITAVQVNRNLVNETISYSDYLAERLESSISYSEYIAEQVIKYDEYGGYGDYEYYGDYSTTRGCNVVIETKCGLKIDQEYEGENVTYVLVGIFKRKLLDMNSPLSVKVIETTKTCLEFVKNYDGSLSPSARYSRKSPKRFTISEFESLIIDNKIKRIK